MFTIMQVAYQSYTPTNYQIVSFYQTIKLHKKKGSCKATAPILYKVKYILFVGSARINLKSLLKTF